MSSSKLNSDASNIFAQLKKLKGQNYDKLKSSCMKENRLFVDDLFLPNDRSIFKSRKIDGIEWKRPNEICKSPKLFVDNASSKDVNQGQLGNCWYTK